MTVYVLTKSRSSQNEETTPRAVGLCPLRRFFGSGVAVALASDALEGLGLVKSVAIAAAGVLSSKGSLLPFSAFGVLR